MAFKRKTDSNGGEQFKFEVKGQKLTGFYLGSFDHDGEYGPTKKHLFKTKKGIKTVFGQTHLTGLLNDEKPGPLMEVTYVSDKKGKKGNPLKMYTLDIDDEEALDAEELPMSAEDAQDNYVDTDSSASTDAEDDTPPEEEEDESEPYGVKTSLARSLQAPKTSAADAKARAEAILNKRRAPSKASA